VSDESLGSAESHFTTEPGGVPPGPGRFVNVDSIKPVEFLPGLGFRPVLGYNAMTNFVSFEPNTEAPKHVHSEEQIVIVLDGEFTFEIDGETRLMRKGDVAVVPAWVPHGAWTTDSTCLEVDVFAPPRQSLLKLAAAQTEDVLAADAAEEEGLVAEAEAEEAAAEKASGA
jgi:quercetin dioxygenase-like cupin family protein